MNEQPYKVTGAISRRGKRIPGRDYYFKKGKVIREHTKGHYFKDTGTAIGRHFNYKKDHFFY